MFLPMKSFLKIACCLVSFAALSASVLSAETLTRGPYLQMGSPSAVTVRWRSSAATDSIVHYGTSAGDLTQTARLSTSTTEHEVRLTGLAAATTYYYSVGSTATTLASGTSCLFVTSPSSARATRIWVLGDSGVANSGQAGVRNAYYTFTGTRHTDFWLMLGDNAYMNGTDAQYQSSLFNSYAVMLKRSVLWPTLGNHDAESSNSGTQVGPYFTWTTLPKNAEAGGVASGTEAYYSFNHGNIHVVCLDSAESSNASTGAMASWLKRDLAANTKDWTIAYWHHAPYSKGSHDSDTDSLMAGMRKNIVPILESYGVDLVLGGHSHAYERSFFLNGHYGTASTFKSSMIVQPGNGRVDGDGAYLKDSLAPTPYSGTVYVVAGSSANAEAGTGKLNHPAMFTSMVVLGSVVLDINGSQLDAQFLDTAGKRRDYFTLRKGSAPANAAPAVALTSPAANATYQTPCSLTLTASATDSNGVTRVDFYDGSALLGTATTSPYSVTWNGVTAGTHSLVARATDSLGATGTSVPVAVKVTGTTTTSHAVTGFTLINADTDQPITRFDPIANGAVLARSALPTTHLNIRVNTNPAIVGSVRLGLDGKANYRTESAAPYALFGDNSSNYNAGTLANGTHTLTATPYTLANAGGAAGTALTVTFTIQ